MNKKPIEENRSSSGRLLQLIDFISEHTGRWASWLCVVLMLVTVYDVMMRYFLNSPTKWAYETGCMLGGALSALGWAYTHLHDGHIRVDVFYRKLSTRRRKIIDIVCALLFTFPLLISLTYVAVSKMWHAWLTGEVMVETYWYPPAGPYRTVIAIGLFIFLFQAIAVFIRDLNILHYEMKGEKVEER